MSGLNMRVWTAFSSCWLRLNYLQDAYQTPSGHAIPQALDRLSLTVVRQSNGWRISHGQNTIVDANAASSNPVLRMPTH